MSGKTCSKCKQFKLVSEFWKNCSKEDGLQSQCKICMGKATADYIASDKGKKTQRKYYTSERGKACRRIREKRFLKTVKGIEYNRRKCRRRYYRDLEYSRLKNNSKYAGVSVGVLGLVQERDVICQMCGSDEFLQFDHIHPISRGGVGSLENLQLLCRDCNVFKADNLILPDGGMLVICS
jgi:5-methylcytosine-specific restriction endonuclease McrA